MIESLNHANIVGNHDDCGLISLGGLLQQFHDFFATYGVQRCGGFVCELVPFCPGQAVAPDLALGALFGLRGFCSMYIGARLQKFIKANIIRIGLGIIIAGLAVRYITGFFL